MNVGNVSFDPKNHTNFCIRDANEHDNEQLLALIAETMPSNGMVLSFERSPSYFQATHVQYDSPEIKVVCLKDQSEKIIAMMNIGFKKCFINQKNNQIRYVSDLRIHQNYRGAKTIELMMDYLYTHVPLDDFLQSIVLEDNHQARHILHKSRSHFPQPYIHDRIITYNISKVPQAFFTDKFKTVALTKELMPAVHQFVGQMKNHFNFLPTYDFHELLDDRSGFWRGLALKDFSVIIEGDADGGQVVGLMGLWNQTGFKQTKVIQYSKSLKWMRPLYNTYASLMGNIQLPAQNDCFEYLMSHSVLSDPNRKDIFAYQLYQLNQQCKAQSKSTYCITLSTDDPRKPIADQCRSHQMRAIHALHSFKNSPLGQFDRSKISYFEVGRI